jgi:hypothetical protein
VGIRCRWSVHYHPGFRVGTSWDGIDSHGTGQVPPVRDWDATRNRDTSRPIGTGLNCPSPPCEREEIAQNGTGFNWDGTRTLGRGTKSGPDSGLRRSNQMSPAVIFGRQRLTADNCPVRTLSRKREPQVGRDSDVGTGQVVSPRKARRNRPPHPDPLPADWERVKDGTGLIETGHERWGMRCRTKNDRRRRSAGGGDPCAHKGKRIPTTSGESFRAVAVRFGHRSGRGRDASIGTGSIRTPPSSPGLAGTRPLTRARLLARRASAPAGSAHLRNYSAALHRFRTAMSKNSDDKKDCPPPESSGHGGRM